MNHKDFAIALAREAGIIIKKNFAFGMKKRWKNDETPITVTDTTINKLVTDAVKREYPTYGLIAEEGSMYSGQDYIWICDPLDGTIAFSHGIPAGTFMLALVVKGKSILGVVYDPFMGHLYYAEKGHGAFLNGKPISVSKTGVMSNSVVGLLMWKRAPYRLRGLFDKLLDLGIRDVRIPAVGYMDMLVASGEFVASIFPGENLWDVAAPQIIVEEAGGRFTDLFGKEIDYTKQIRGTLASNGILHDELVKLVQESLVG